MHSRAKVYRRAHSPYYHAWFMVWDAKKQAWKAKTQSTKCADEAKALEIAQEFERIAAAASGMKSHLSREFVVSAVNSILTTAGHRPVQDQKSWADYSARWLEAQKKRVPKNLSLRTWQTYQSHLARFDQFLGKQQTMPLGAIEGPLVQDWYDSILTAGLSPSTANNMATTLSVIFEKAKNEGFTTRNPVALLVRDDSGGNRRDDFTLDQMNQILAHLRASPIALHAEWLTVALLGFCTSQRLGDCRRAVRSAFEVTPDLIVWAIQPRKTSRSTGTTLRIPIVEPAASHIRQLLQRPASSLFLAPALAEADDAAWQDSPSTQFMQILADCGITGRQIKGKGQGRSFNSLSFHSTRHTCNSLLANAGVPFEMRKLITGHASAEMNATYTHIKDGTAAKALKKAFTPKKKVS